MAHIRIPDHANLTPEEMRRGIKRLKHRIAEAEAFNPNVNRSNDRNSIIDEVEVAGQELRDNVLSTFNKVFPHNTLEHARYCGATDECYKTFFLVKNLTPQETLRALCIVKSY
jgi:hypothetical protein